MKLKVKKLRPDAVEPRYASDGAAGLDLSAALDAPIVFEPGSRALVSTGIAIELPVGHEGQVRPRSGLASKHGITVVNAPGTIDEDYRGEVKVALINLGTEPYTIASGDRIAQLVVAPVTKVGVDVVVELGPTSRDTGGFGSTGRA